VGHTLGVATSLGRFASVNDAASLTAHRAYRDVPPGDRNPVLRDTSGNHHRIMPTPLPIACSLTADQLDAQRESLLLGLADHAVQRTPLPSGMRLRFPATAERMRQIDTVVRHERECCPFLEFRVGLSGSVLTLDVTGPDGTASLLAELLDPSFAS
jgi:hypothetical protein